MKYLVAALLCATGAFASHSVDLGGFYTEHKESGYRYNFGGLALSYEIGNSKGLKARGKILTSNNSDLLFIKAQSELHWYIPLQQFHIIPFAGGHITRHEVFREGGALGTLVRYYAPFGLGFHHPIGDFSYEIRAAHMHPLTCNYIYEEGTAEFWGKKYYLPSAYLANARIAYHTGEKISFAFLSQWIGDYRQKMREWTVEMNLNLGF